MSNADRKAFERFLSGLSPSRRASIEKEILEDSNPESQDQNLPESYYGLPPKGVQAGRKHSDSKILREVLASLPTSRRASMEALLLEDADPESLDQNLPDFYYGFEPRGVQAGIRLASEITGLEAIILEFIVDSGQGFTASEISGELGVSLDKVQRSLSKIEDAGYIQSRAGSYFAVAGKRLASTSKRKAGGRITPEQMQVTYPYSRTIRLSVYNASYSGYFETRVGPNQEADLIRQLREAGFTVDPYDLEEAIAIAS